MQKLVWINSKGTEINLTSGDYGITEWEGFSACDLEVQTQNVPFQDGSVFLDALLNNRELSVTLAINDGKDLEKRYRLRRELISALNPKLGEGYLIYTNDFISKRIKCLAQMPVFPTHNSDKAGTPKASLSWTACDPYWEDLEETSVEFNTEERPIIINNGDVNTQIKVKILSTDITNPCIKDVLTDKKIQLLNTYKDYIININTNVGEKSVTLQKLTFDYYGGGVFNDTSYINGEIFICGNSNLLIKSKDGKKWNGIFVGENKSDLKTIKYINGIYFLLGQYNAIFTSDNGVNWNLRNYGSNSLSSLRGLAYSNNLSLYVAVGGKVYTSSDAINWTESINLYLEDIVYSEDLNLFVAVGNTKVYTSSDAINWTERSYPGNARGIYSILYNSDNSLFVAVGDELIITSSDGINWEKFTISGTNIGLLLKVIYNKSKNQYIAVGGEERSSTSYRYVVRSSDGINWENGFTYGDSEGKNYKFSSVTYSEDLAEYIITQNKFGYFISYDGYTLYAQRKNEIYFDTCIFFNNKYIACGKMDLGTTQTRGAIIAISQDGLSWDKILLQYNGSNINVYYMSIIYFNLTKMFIACGGSYISTSNDLINWNTIKSEPIGSNICLSCSDTKIVLFQSRNSTIYVYNSSDGIVWNQVSTISGFTPYKCIYCKDINLFITVGSSGGAYQHIMKSSDGINWTSMIIETSQHVVHDVIYAFKIIVAVSNGGLYICKNRTDWVKKIEGVFYNITYSQKLSAFIAFGIRSYLSYDGENWSPLNIIQLETNCSVSNTNNTDIVFLGGDETIIKNSFIDNQNIINDLSSDSDIGLNLNVGENVFRVFADNGNVKALLSYRQKYIGV